MAYWPVGREVSADQGVHHYERRRPEQTLLYQLVDQHYPAFVAQLATQGTPLPEYVRREFEDYLECGRLEHGFLRVRCTACYMAESAALLVDDILPKAPMRQWVLSFPYALRFLFATRPAVMGNVLGVVCRTLATYQVRKAGYTRRTANTGAVTLIQRFGSALNLNIHLMCMDARMPRAHGCVGAVHILFLDGVYASERGRATQILQQVGQAISRWGEFAQEAGVSDEAIRKIVHAHRSGLIS